MKCCIEIGNSIVAEGGKAGFGGTGGNQGWAYNGYGGYYQKITNGTNGNNGLDGNNYDYNYPYNSSTQLRTYIPSSYIPVYPLSNSKGGSGSVPSWYSNAGSNGEDGFIIISY